MNKHQPGAKAAAIVGQQIGDYWLDSVLGRGGSSVVYKARHAVLDEVVALKVIHDHARLERLSLEARILNTLDHPNIVKLRTVSLTTEPPFVAMEWIAGQSLREVLKKQGPWPWFEAWSLFEQLCSAIRHAHEQEVIHGDVKPENILINEDGQAFVVDFGFASWNLNRDSLQLSADLQDDHNQGLWGTVGYAAPEQLAGQNIDARADVYSLSVLLFETLTGQMPQPGDRLTELIPEGLDAPPAAFDDLFSACYCRRERRLDGVAEFWSQLEAIKAASEQQQALKISVSERQDLDPEGADLMAIDDPAFLLEIRALLKHLNAGDFDGAHKQLQVILQGWPVHPQALALQNRTQRLRSKVEESRTKLSIHRSLGEYDAALAMTRELLELTPGDRVLRTDLQLMRGLIGARLRALQDIRAMHAEARFDDALKHCEMVLQSLPKDRLVRERQVALRRSKSAFEGTIKNLKRSIEVRNITRAQALLTRLQSECPYYPEIPVLEQALKAAKERRESRTAMILTVFALVVMIAIPASLALINQSKFQARRWSRTHSRAQRSPSFGLRSKTTAETPLEPKAGLQDRPSSEPVPKKTEPSQPAPMIPRVVRPSKISQADREWAASRLSGKHSKAQYWRSQGKEEAKQQHWREALACYQKAKELGAPVRYDIDLMRRVLAMEEAAEARREGRWSEALRAYQKAEDAGEYVRPQIREMNQRLRRIKGKPKTKTETKTEEALELAKQAESRQQWELALYWYRKLDTLGVPSDLAIARMKRRLKARSRRR